MKVLLVGVSYHATPYALEGCLPDIRNWQKYLKSRRDIESIEIMEDVTRKKDDPNYPSRTNFVAKLYKLINEMTRGDVLFVHFSGHGFQTGTTSGVFTTSGAHIDGATTECLLLRHAAQTPNHNIGVDNTVCDEQVTQLFRRLPTGAKVLMTVDACNSGDMFDLTYNVQTTGVTNGGRVEYTMRKNENRQDYDAHVVIFTSVRSKQFAWDVKGKDGNSYGVFSKFFIDILRESQQAQKQLSYLDMLHLIQKRLNERKNTQDPQLSISHMGALHGLVVLSGVL